MLCSYAIVGEKYKSGYKSCRPKGLREPISSRVRRTPWQVFPSFVFFTNPEVNRYVQHSSLPLYTLELAEVDSLKPDSNSNSSSNNNSNNNNNNNNNNNKNNNCRPPSTNAHKFTTVRDTLLREILATANSSYVHTSNIT